MSDISPKLEEILTQIAKRNLRVSTLKTRNRDSLDFHDVAVWKIKNALFEAYLAGKNED